MYFTWKAFLIITFGHCEQNAKPQGLIFAINYSQQTYEERLERIYSRRPSTCFFWEYCSSMVCSTSKVDLMVTAKLLVGSLQWSCLKFGSQF